MKELEVRAGEARAYIESLPPSMRREAEAMYETWRNGPGPWRGINPDGSFRFPTMARNLIAILRDES